MIWHEEWLECRPGWSGRPLLMDRLRVWRRQVERPPLKWGGVIQKRPEYWRCETVTRWGRPEQMWHWEHPSSWVAALVAPPAHQQGRRQA